VYKYFTGKDALLEAKKDVPEEVYTLMRYGLPGMAGVDLSGSVSLNMLDMGNDNPLMMAAGAPGKVLENLGKAGEFYQRGDNYRALETVAPMFAKYPMQAYREHTEGMTTKRGQALADLQGQPYKLTLQEALGKGAGFQPISKSNQFDTRTMIEETKKHQNDFGDKLATQMLTAIKNKDQASMHDLTLQLVEYNKYALERNMPPVDITDRIRQRLMPKMVEKKWYPYAKQFEQSGRK
jgi:hypothetical protein